MQRAWCEKEQSVGGGRLLALGDLLLQAGEAQQAGLAYRRAGEHNRERVQERQSLATLLETVQRQAGPEAIQGALEEARELVPQSFWPDLIAAIGLRIANDIPKTQAAILRAEQRGAPESICRLMRRLINLEANPSEDLEAFGDPPFSAKLEALLRWMVDRNSPPARLKQFVEVFGEDWVAYCPFDPADAARRLLADWHENGEWDQAKNFAESLERIDAEWASELRQLALVRHALMLAITGRLDEADSQLVDLEKCGTH